jgi:hypothetical protein
MPGYYDLDEFLAEEEAIQCQTAFDFSHLSYLDPDAPPGTTSTNHNNNVLPEHSKVKIPMWAIRKWAELSFCRLLVPIQYRVAARELILADPASVTLRPRYDTSGLLLVNLMESSCHKQAQMLYTQPSSVERNAQLQQLEGTLQEARQIRETLVQVRRLILVLLTVKMIPQLCLHSS